VVISQSHKVEVPCYEVAEGELPRELRRFEEAISQTRQQLERIQGEVQTAMGLRNAQIFDAQLLFLEDPVLLDEVVGQLNARRINVEQALSAATEKYFAAFTTIEDGYFRERVSDLRDVAQRLLRNLLGIELITDLAKIREPCVLVAHDLTPSQTAVLDRRMVLGFATDQGSETAHTALLAQSLHLPAVAGLINAASRLHTGQYVLLDGFNGLMVIDPTDQTLFEYGQLAERQLAIEVRLRCVRDLTAVTLDGHRITLSANIETPEEARDAQESGAEGVGLMRTEYLFTERGAPPDEEEQFIAYDRVARALHPQPVIIRTLDIGGDKVSQLWPNADERNPFLGWRAIRVCLEEPELFRAQLRAILRASAAGNVKLMYPMISSVLELDQANALLEECKAQLKAEGRAFDPGIEVGAMIEIPAAAAAADLLASRVRFFSIGTNDLIQYALAVDRLNPKVARLYEPTHPGVLRLIHTTVQAAHAAKIWVGVCGGMAGDPLMVPLLLGLGVDELSTTPTRVPAVKFLIRRVQLPEVVDLARAALACADGRVTARLCREFVGSVAPDLFEQQPEAPAAPAP